MKRVICSLDGTWNHNRPGAILTNVCKLHQVIAANDASGVRQASHYIEGIVSTQTETMQFLKGGLGFGVDDRIRKAYTLLSDDYEPGDEIYLFGFSRGAFEARSLASLITLTGIAKAGGAFSLDKAWSLYRTPAGKRDPAVLAELRAAAHYPVRIKCVGVWDTVGNLGNPFASRGLLSLLNRRFAFHDMRLSDNIDVGLYALSIDELRGPFRPTLWTLPNDQGLPSHQHVEQVWFAGTHGDVGGGHRETGLSDLALVWMVERVKATTGLALDTKLLDQMARPDPLGPQHSVAEGWIFRWSRVCPFIRLVKQATAGIPRVRRLLLGFWRTSKLPRGVAAVNESIHDSVLERFGKRVIELRPQAARTLTYRPYNLRPVIAPITATLQEAGRPRRLKMFTVPRQLR